MSMGRIKAIGMGAGIAAVVAIGLIATSGQMVPRFEVPRGCDVGERPEWDGSAWQCGGIDLELSTSDDVAPEQDWIARNGTWFIGVDVANTTKARDFVLAGHKLTYSCGDAVVSNGSTTITSAAQCGFSSNYIGSTITGTNIPAGTTIAAVAGATSATLSQSATGTGTIRATITKTGANDDLYVKHRGGLGFTFGVGVTPPDGSYRLQVSGFDSEPAMGGLGVRVGPSQTGHALAVRDSSAIARFYVDSAFYLTGNHSGCGSATCIQAESTNQRPLVFTKNDKSTFWGFQYSGNNMLFRYFTGGVNAWQASTSGAFTAPVSPTFGDTNDDTSTLWGHLRVEGTAPTASSCGTSPSTTGTDLAFRGTTGSGASACTWTFSRTHTVIPVCVVRTEGSATQPACTVSATAITCATAAASTAYHWHCITPTGGT